MPKFSTRRRVKHSADEMFDLVADIERYPQFVPLCRAMRVIRRAQLAGCDIIVAEMTVAYKLIRESFTSRVTLDRVRRTILVEYLDGPFSRMENRWTFRPVGDAGEEASGVPAVCDVGFFIFYEFRSRALGLLMGAMFETAFRRFAFAFETRADAVFGPAHTVREQFGAPEVG
jgi:coenzyme Q-binding protein COQ10